MNLGNFIIDSRLPGKRELPAGSLLNEETQGMESIMQKETDKKRNHDGSEGSGRNKTDSENTSGGKKVGRGLGRGGGKGRRDGTGGGRGRGGGGKGGRRK